MNAYESDGHSLYLYVDFLIVVPMISDLVTNTEDTK